MVVKYRPADRGTTLSIQRTYFEKDLTVSAISNIVTVTGKSLPSSRYGRQESLWASGPHLPADSLARQVASHSSRYGRRESIWLTLQRYGRLLVAIPVDFYIHSPHLFLRNTRNWSPQISNAPPSVRASIRSLSDIARTSTRPRYRFCTSSDSFDTSTTDLRRLLLGFDNPPNYNMLTYTEYYQSTPSPLGVGPARDLAYQTIYDYFAEETATPILLGRLLDLFESEAVGALGIFLTNTFGKARLRLVHGLR
eukprot:jgi/Psemu1/60822/gm1.60822_g